MSHASTSRRLGLCAAAGLAMAASGCATSPTPRFYSLSSIKGPSSTAPATQPAAVVAVGPVTIPDYADRPEIVTTVGPNELSVHDFDRWGGDLGKGLARAIIEDLAASLPAGNFEVVPWDPSASADHLAGNRVTVTVTRFDLSPGPGGAAVLEAEWMLYGPRGKALAMKKSSEKAPAQGRGIKDVVAAMSRCVAELSGEIVRKIADSR